MSAIDIHTIINDVHTIPQESELRLIGCLEEKWYPKGLYILKAGAVETSVYFMKKGLARIFSEVNNKEISFWFGREGDTILSFESYINDKPGYETVELIEDSILFILKKEDLFNLYRSDIHIANWGRRFAEKEMLKVEKRMISLLSMDATERYTELLSTMPDFLQRIPLGMISSYLGVTQTTLSRIRAKIR